MTRKCSENATGIQSLTLPLAFTALGAMGITGKRYGTKCSGGRVPNLDNVGYAAAEYRNSCFSTRGICRRAEKNGGRRRVRQDSVGQRLESL